MTARVLFIGNSHLVAIQSALQADPGRWLGISARFHGFRGTSVLQTAVEGDHLVPTDADAAAQFDRFTGAPRIDLRGADLIVVVGFNVKVQHALTFWKAVRWPDLPSTLAAEDLVPLPQLLMSRQAVVAGLAGYLAGLAGFVLAARLRAATGLPVLLIGHPRLHRRVKFAQMGRFFGLGRAVARGDGPDISALFETAAARAAQAADIIHLPQPGHTICEDLMTHPRFMAGEIEVNHPAGHRHLRQDFSHPAPAYGALMLDRIAQGAAA